MKRAGAGTGAGAVVLALAGCGGGGGGAPDANVAPPDAATAPAAAVRYPDDRTQSPITAEIAANLIAIAARGPDQDEHVFAKVGDSITEAPSFLHCFAGTGFDLGARADLADTRDWFAAGVTGTTTPYDRESLAAVIGWSASAPLAGSPDPLDQELAATAPRYATLMFGTNDVQFRTPDAFGTDLWNLVDIMTSRGVIPLMSTIPPQADPTVDVHIPLFNLIVRAIAQGRMVPMVDFHRELEPLAGQGLGPDGVHPNTSPDGACALTVAGLGYGFDVRNLITLDQLDRARAARDGGAPPDPDTPRRQGGGTAADPYLATLPYAEMADTRAGVDGIDVYTGCNAAQNESGPEIVYRLDLTSTVHLGAYVVDRGTTDVDVHILDGAVTGAACVARGHQSAVADVGPGTVYVVVDSFVDSTGVHDGEYLLLLEAE